MQRSTDVAWKEQLKPVSRGSPTQRRHGPSIKHSLTQKCRLAPTLLGHCSGCGEASGTNTRSLLLWGLDCCGGT